MHGGLERFGDGWMDTHYEHDKAVIDCASEGVHARIIGWKDTIC